MLKPESLPLHKQQSASAYQNFYHTYSRSTRPSLAMGLCAVYDTDAEADNAVCSGRHCLYGQHSWYQTNHRPSIKVVATTALSFVVGFIMATTITGISSANHSNNFTQQQQSRISEVNSTGTRVTSCGDTPEEARAQGCIFDVVSFSWLPSQCYDAALSMEFLNHRAWEWYQSKEEPGSSTGQAPISKEVVAKGETGDLFVTGSYHMIHCLFMWRKLHRGMNLEAQMLLPGSSGAWVDSYTRDFAHTHHCTEYLLGLEQRAFEMMPSRTTMVAGVTHKDQQERNSLKDELDAVKVKIRVKYPSCPTHLDWP